MANGKSKKLKKILGMTKRPTKAGQTKFGDADVRGKTSSSQGTAATTKALMEYAEEGGLTQRDIRQLDLQAGGAEAGHRYLSTSDSDNYSTDFVTRAKDAGWKGYDEGLWPMGPEAQAIRFLDIGDASSPWKLIR